MGLADLSNYQKERRTMTYNQVDAFPDCKKDSPRLAWMKRNGICVRWVKRKKEPMLYYVIEAALRCKRVKHPPSSELSETRDAALEKWAIEHGVLMWDEEEYANFLKQKRAGSVAVAQRDLTPQV